MIDGLDEIDWDTVKARHTHITHIAKNKLKLCYSLWLEKDYEGNMSFLGGLLCGSSLKSISDQRNYLHNWEAVK
jgi:hypothetical protein